MPLPQTQLDQLQTELQQHEQALTDLEGHPTKTPRIHQWIAFHQAVLHVGRDAQVLSALQDLYDHPALAQELAAHPEAFLQARHIQLPQGTTKVVASQPDAQSVVATVHIHLQEFDVGLEWSSRGGFTARQLDPNA